MKIMEKWIISLDNNYWAIFQRVVLIKNDSQNVWKTIYKNEEYIIDFNKIREINKPEFIYNDIVSPKNHPELIGKIVDIIYHFKQNRPMFFIEVNN
jgi:hypothetical protein